MIMTTGRLAMISDRIQQLFTHLAKHQQRALRPIEHRTWIAHEAIVDLLANVDHRFGIAKVEILHDGAYLQYDSRSAQKRVLKSL